MAKHTPGPWTTIKRQDEIAPTLVLGAEGEIVSECSSYYTGRSDVEAEANATLIAAAPAMLVALKFAKAELVRLHAAGVPVHSLGAIELSIASAEATP